MSGVRYGEAGIPQIPGVQQWFMGLDIGRVRDFSAITVIARTWHEVGPAVENRYTVMYARRFELGTPYATVEEACANIFHDPELDRPIFVADQTGVGDPVVEALKRQYHCRVIGVHLTGGSTVSEPEPGHYHVAKEVLATNLVRLAERRKLKVSRPDV